VCHYHFRSGALLAASLKCRVAISALFFVQEDDESEAVFTSTLSLAEVHLQSNTEVARAVQWMQKYEMAFSDVASSNEVSLIQINLLVRVLEKFHPLVMNLSPKSELLKNTKKMADGGKTAEECDLDARNDVLELPDTFEGPRSGVQWAFFEFEFVVMCLAAIINDIRQHCGIVDGDDKKRFLEEIQHAEKRKAIPGGRTNSLAQQVFTSTLQLHQKQQFSEMAAMALGKVLTTAMAMKLRWASMSKFMGYFDFELAKDWRAFLMISERVCIRLRGNNEALSGVFKDESAVGLYEESYAALRSYADGSEGTTWWETAQSRDHSLTC